MVMAHRLRLAASIIAQLAGVALLLVVCYSLHVLVGLAATAVALIGAGILLDSPVVVLRRPEPPAGDG